MSFKAILAMVIGLALPVFAAAGPIIVLGDLEGQGFKLDQFIRESGGFQASPWGGLRLRPGVRFVFMGDALDRGPEGMRILDTMVALKKQYPDQVVLLMGNRDVNKLPLRFIFQNAANPIQRLKDFLDGINASEAFEFRRQELSARGQPASDRDVFNSTVGDVAPGGRMTEYLELAQVGHVDEETGGLFVHGAISDQSVGYVPGHPGRIADVRTWIKTLNAWAHAFPREILAYQGPRAETPGRNDMSVTYGRFLGADNNPHLPADSVIEALKAQGLHYVVAGHSSVGDVPVLMSAPDFRVILVDNSYAKPGSSAWTRIEAGQIELGGHTEGRVFTAKVPILGESAVGSLSPDGWRLLGKVDTGEWLEWQIQGRYRSAYRLLTDAQLCGRRMTRR